MTRSGSGVRHGSACGPYQRRQVLCRSGLGFVRGIIRGEIWSVAGGIYASKPPPAVALQDNRFDGTPSVTVCPLTATRVAVPLLRMPLPTDALTGLDEASFVMVDKITTVRRANVGQKIGRMSSSQLVDLERLIMVFLGLAD